MTRVTLVGASPGTWIGWTSTIARWMEQPRGRIAVGIDSLIPQFARVKLAPTKHVCL